MTLRNLLFTVLLVALFTLPTDGSPSPAAESGDETAFTFVLVHGASGGGWDWRTMDELLTSRGHTVYRPTLTGLGERAHLNSPEINLSTHVTDIVNVIRFEGLENVVLVGHSYGGMVITGVMDAIPERIRHAIFLDAAVPEDGQSAQDFWPSISGNHDVRDGIVYFRWLDPAGPVPGDVPQSLATLTEAVSFDNPLATALPATAIVFVSEDAGAADLDANPSWRNAGKRDWNRLTLVSDHNAQRSHPEELADMLEAAPVR